MPAKTLVYAASSYPWPKKSKDGSPGTRLILDSILRKPQPILAKTDLENRRSKHLVRWYLKMMSKGNGVDNIFGNRQLFVEHQKKIGRAIQPLHHVPDANIPSRRLKGFVQVSLTEKAREGYHYSSNFTPPCIFGECEYCRGCVPAFLYTLDPDLMLTCDLPPSPQSRVAPDGGISTPMWYNLEIEVDATSSFVTIPVCMPCSMSMSSEGCLYRGGQYRMAWGDDGTCRIVKRQRRSHAQKPTTNVVKAEHLDTKSLTVRFADPVISQVNVFSKFSKVKLDEVKEDCPNYGMEEKCPDYEVEEDCHKETTSPSEISLKIVFSDTNSAKLLQDPARILPLRVQGKVERDEVDEYYLISIQRRAIHQAHKQLATLPSAKSPNRRFGDGEFKAEESNLRTRSNVTSPSEHRGDDEANLDSGGHGQGDPEKPSRR